MALAEEFPAACANLFTTPRHRAAFRALVNQMRADGLELVDVERIGPSGNPRFVGVFSPGNGEGIISTPRNLHDFMAFGLTQTQNGLRTRDMEMVVVEQAEDDSSFPSDMPGATDAGLPDLPRWIELTDRRELVIDWGLMVETGVGEVPRMTIWREALPDYLPRKNDEQDIIFPDTFCGMNITQVESINWQVGEEIIDIHPFNYVPDVDAINLNFQLDGIEFSGPIGGCEGSNQGWDFPFPITQTGPFEPLENMKLVLGLDPGAEIRFITHQPPEGDFMDAHELFSSEIFDHMIEMAKSFNLFLMIDNGYCGIDQYLERICEEEGRNDSKCLIGADFANVSPC